MDVASSQHRLELPRSLRAQLLQFRSRVWWIKLIEAVSAVLFGVLTAFLLVFLLDRFWDTAAMVRQSIFAVAAAICMLIPLTLHRWVWRRRKLEQLARLLGRRHPSIGDQLLGIIELAQSETEQARSIKLCEAAIEQVAHQAESRNFADAVPKPRHVLYGILAAVTLMVGLELVYLYPAAMSNAWARFVRPWSDTPRYTFAMVKPLPNRLIVPHGEPFTLTIELAEQTVSHPHQAEVTLGTQTKVSATLARDRYAFALPAQIDSGWLDIRVGDFSKRVHVEPTLRPELSSLVADVQLPKYLNRAEAQRRDVRGGSISLVNGSRVRFTARATRELASAFVDHRTVPTDGAEVTIPRAPVDGRETFDLEWRDRFGLEGKEPFTVAIDGHEDEAPSLACSELPRKRIVLVTEQLGFTVTAQDDFGVKRVGMQWQGMDATHFENPAHGERILSAGGPEKQRLELKGTFSAVTLKIEPQPIQLRLFVEDYYPGRERVYSPTYELYVLTAEQHAIWLTEQLNRWHRQSLDVRDRELQLYETNKELRQLTSEELDQPDSRRRIERQAFAERTNGGRLGRLVQTGEGLIQQAMRNPEFGVGHLEKWAEMLQILKDISANRMPSVADLLKQASQAPQMAAKSAKKNPPTAGQVRASTSGKPAEPADKDASKKGTVPAVVDIESTQQPIKPNDQPAKKQQSAPPAMSLPNTLLISQDRKNDARPVNQKMAEAVEQQRDLLVEFEKIADELNQILAKLEGSTLVKRLKAASRRQYNIAGQLGGQVQEAFGVSAEQLRAPQHEVFAGLSKEETESSQDVSNIMDDMQGYFERRRFVRFKSVLDDMVHQDVVGSLRNLGDDLAKKSGLTIAQCEFWSDTLDRWAEDLVEVCSGGT